MILEWRRASVLTALAIVVGWVGWSGNVLLLPVATLFPLLWSLARTRLQAAASASGYFLSASRGLPQGVMNFYDTDIWPGLALWLVAASGFVFTHAVLWKEGTGWRKAFRYLAIAVAMALPPFGILGWAHPVTAAGVILPGWGWSGLAAMAAGLWVMTTRLWPAAAISLAGLWLWSAACWTPALLPASWQGVDLRSGASLGRTASLDHHRALAVTVRASVRNRLAVVVLPESALGFWTPTVERFWRRQLTGSGVTILAGAAVIDDAGYDNVIVSVSKSGSEVVYRERMPVPGAMWHPWRKWTGKLGGARAHVSGDAVAVVGGITIAPLICYEQLLVWPVLQSVLHDPDVIIAIGNGWWTKGTSIIDVQKASTEAWARLFGLPLVMSFNT